MSTLNVEGIKNTAATSDTITFATDGTCTAKVTNNQSNRNLVINGAMSVAQYGASSGSSGFKTVDRFAFYGTGLNAAVTVTQADVASGTTPYTLGFRKSHKIANGAQTGPDAGDYIYFSHKIEAQDMATSGWNYTSASSYVTLSFWIKSSVAQNFYGYLKTADGTSQNYPFETGALSANTWTKITKTIPGHANLQFDMDANMGVEVVIAPFFGTDKTGSISLNAWGAWSSSNRLPDMTSTWFTTNGATFEYTGVQLTVTDYCPDYPHSSYDDELRRCYRYCQKYHPNGNTYRFLCQGNVDNDGNNLAMFLPFIHEFRDEPALTTTGSASDYAVRRDTTQTCTSVPTAHSTGTQSTGMTFIKSSHGWATGQSVKAFFKTAGSYLIFAAEM